jgi:type II secretory pathway pseudopilin PulG
MTEILPTLVRRSDGWSIAAVENNARVIRGSILTFSDWHWHIRGDSAHIDGRKLVAIGTQALWQKWENGKPAEHILREPDKQLPERDELGDTDATAWETGPGGAPKDPWSNTRLVYLLDPETAELFTFSTSSWGGRSAVSELGDQIMRMRCGKPDAVPLVELCASPMVTKFGRKSKPHLKVINWRNTGAESVEEISDRTESERALDDFLPF